MPKNWKGDPLGFFNIHSVAKHQKIEGGKFFYFRKKISQCRKNWKRGPFGIFQHPFWRKTAKKIEGGILWEKNFPKKSLAVPKKIERGSRPVWYVTRENRKTVSECRLKTTGGNLQTSLLLLIKNGKNAIKNSHVSWNFFVLFLMIISSASARWKI